MMRKGTDERVYYVAHRLFALHDRALGAFVACELANRVGGDQVFLPFCDTSEEALISPCKGRTIFELDVERLQRLQGMIAILHGPSLDDGVCMEVGYACRLNVPVMLLTTDFQTYGLSCTEAELQFPDPLLEVIASDVVRVSRLSTFEESAESRFITFWRRNMEPLAEAARIAVDRLLSNSVQEHDVCISPISSSAFLEPSPYMREEQVEQIRRELQSRGLTVQRACRLDPENLTREEIVNQSRIDWDQLKRTELLVVDVNGPETPPGAAMLIGASVADSRPVLASYRGRSFTFAPGREPNFRNLMIQYSLSGLFRTTGELRRLLER